MDIKFVSIFDHAYTSAYDVKKLTVNVKGRIQTLTAITIQSRFEFKDELKQWCRSRDGGWQDIQKLWWVPATEDNLKDLKQLSFFSGKFTTQKPKIQNWIMRTLEDKQTEDDGIVYGKFVVNPEDEKNYNSYPDFELAGEAIPQTQGWVEIQGEEVRVVVHPGEPKSNLKDEILNHHWRKFETVWCIPWTNPLDKSDLGGWDDYDDESEKTLKTEESLPTAMKLKLLKNKAGEPTGIRCYIESTERFNTFLDWAKMWEGREWNATLKCWDIPYGERIVGNIKFMQRVWQGRYLIYCSETLQNSVDKSAEVYV